MDFTGTKPYIMGILNVTPDSFFDGGKHNTFDSALYQTEKMISDGADIIDVGGESTRPGYEKISDAEEIERTIPVIEEIKKRFDVTVSLDTYKYGVMKAGIRAGVDIINDIWGLKWDAVNGETDNFAATIVADANVDIILMHNRTSAQSEDFDTFIDEMKESLTIAHEAGIKDERIVIDPGIGFGKTLEFNRTVIRRLDEFGKLGYPVLLGISNKSVIGRTLDLDIDERLSGTIALNVYGYVKGCRIFRVHDVLENKRALDMMESIMNS